ncbi:GntR family transcriptional regulator [Gemmatimonas sp. UBA7669]|uniref:GntR family transcriptional regulator n=1 Tax=Gemmatimonas sp. UBA7669 TaxID=1946568 RepID=UPI0025C0EAA9|nr:GntR family transcriptional regulator [Gemmatimonas sp. UBA7669]
MLSFPVVLVPGESPYKQVVYAATKAIVAGTMSAGTPFPSVRELSQALRINPNTAHKIVAELVRQGLLEVHPGRGTVVAEQPEASPQAQRALLSRQVEALVVEAKRLGIEEGTVLEAVREQWQVLTPPVSAAHSQPIGAGNGKDQSHE